MSVRLVRTLIFCAAAALLAGCGPNASIVNSNKGGPSANLAPAKTDYERDLESMRTANLQYVFVVRRKDAGKLDADDKKFIRAIAADTNRFYLTDDDKAIIAGSNFPYKPETIKTLQVRFTFQDLSEGGNITAPVDMNSNANIKPAR